MTTWYTVLLNWLADLGADESSIAVLREREPSPGLEYAARATAMRSVLRVHSCPETLAAIESFVSLCDRAAAGNFPTVEEWDAAIDRAEQSKWARRVAEYGWLNPVNSAILALESRRNGAETLEEYRSAHRELVSDLLESLSK